MARPGYVADVVSALCEDGFYFTTERYRDRTISRDWGQTFVARKWMQEQCSRIGYRYGARSEEHTS